MRLEIRDWDPADASQLLGLMRELAVFEGYIDEFTVGEHDLLQRGLGDAPEFIAKVADSEGTLVGMAVAYEVPFTWNLKPTLYLKELFVREEARSNGVGRRLLAALAWEAFARGCGAMRWSVLAGNERGADFYRGLGARHDSKWEPWLLDESGIEALAAEGR